MDDWMLYESESPWTGESRGLNIGYIYSRDGRHVATCVQEGLLRVSDRAKKLKAKL
jgi:acyl-CoA thioesterase II